MCGHCVKCGTWRPSLHNDHVIPKWAGGSDEPSNRQWLCANCHEDKTKAELQSRAFKDRPRERKPRRFKPDVSLSYTARYERRHATPSGIVLREKPN